MNCPKLLLVIFLLIRAVSAPLQSLLYSFRNINTNEKQGSMCEHLPADFRVDFNVCNQYEVDFSNTSFNTTVVEWQFGDGATAIDSEKISHVYKAEGVYKARLVVQNQYGCLDTVSKKFLLSIDKGHIFINKKLSVCKGSQIKLPGDSEAVANCWSPDIYLSSIAIYNPVCQPARDTAYQYNIIKKGKDLVPNGTFKAGNIGFSTQYTYDSNNSRSGFYYITSKPELWNPLYKNCNLDSNGVEDTMMIVNGSTKKNTTVWQATVHVTPNTNYVFYFFAQSLTPTKSVVLDASVGEVESLIRLPDSACIRKRFVTSWYSDTNTSVKIRITNLNTNSAKNNFALDTISFRPVFLKTDSIQVGFFPPPVLAIQPASSTICPGDSLLLSATGGDSYKWFSPSSVKQPYAPATYVYPKVNTTYKVLITENRCNTTDSLFAIVNVYMPPQIKVSKSNDVSCTEVKTTLNATGGIQYHWQPENFLSNPDVPNPVAMPNDTTMYYVYVTDTNGCSGQDSIEVAVSKTFTQYLIPNAFTPNGDGLNDCFGVYKWGNILNLRFLIYNRWGEVIFSTSDFSKCWDGTHRGVPQLTGTYIFLIQGKTLCGNIIRKGTIVLLR